MKKSGSFFQSIKQRIPPKYRLVTFLVVTSVIGIVLIFLAVYNTSKDLELIHEIDNLHRIAKASLTANQREDELIRALHSHAMIGYQVLILENIETAQLSASDLPAEFPLAIDELEQSRINDRGGYIELDDRIYTWVKLPISGTTKHVVLIHKFAESSLSSLLQIYLKRLIVPAIFYVWLMIWVGLIIRFLTDKLLSQNKELERMALYDSLTGLPNRILLNDRLQKLIQDCRRKQRSFALAVIDLNKFKAVNDNLGHDQGDDLLCQVANRISKLLRTSDTVSRIGGDEFVLLLNDVDAESCLHKCEEIQRTVLKPYVLREGDVSIGLSIGIAMFPAHGVDPITLMRNADLAMYAIKTNGGGVQLYPGAQDNMATTVPNVS